MNDCDTSISTRAASELLGVHESSVKRWCNASSLDCEYTPGGHRRIPLQSLLTFAEGHDLPISLLAFSEDADTVWSATESASRCGDYDMLIRVTLSWLQQGRGALLDSLLSFLRERGISNALAFDHLMVPVLRHVGDEYVTGNFSIGDEHRITQQIRDALIRACPTHATPAKDEIQPCAIVGCARSVSHELGALMVRYLLATSGWRVVYLGADVPTEEFASQQRKHGARLVCISLVPPVCFTELTTITALLNQMYSSDSPYSLAFGGSSLTTNAARRMPIQDTRIPETRIFEQLDPFTAWSASLL